MGNKAFSKVQMGREATNGTAVAADFIWRGPFAGLKDARVTNLVEEDIGVALHSSRSYIAQLMAEWSQPATPFTPEQSPHIFEAGIKRVETGVADGDSTSGYTYEYPFPITALNAIGAYTIETGDEDQAEEAEYCFVRSFTITGTRGESLMISSEWAGRRVQDVTFTAGQVAPAVSHVHASAGSLFIDDNTDPFGTTAIGAGNIYEFTLSVTTGLTALFTIDSGQLYFVEVYFNKDAFEASLEIKWLHKATAIAERGKWRTNEPRLIRLQFTGDAYSDAGTTTMLGGFKGLQIDFPGSYTEFSAVEHDEGKSVITATLGGGYDNDSAEGLVIRVANEIAAIP